MTHDQRWTDLAERFELARLDVATLHHHRHVWKNLLVMLSANPEIEHHSVVNQWLTRGYTGTIAVGIRRQAEARPGRLTVGGVLSDLESHASEVTADQFRMQVPVGVPRDQDRWHQFGGTSDAEAFDANIATAYLRTLKRCSDPARAFVNQRLAHKGVDERTSPINLTFPDLDRGLDCLGFLTMAIYPLFHGGGELANITPIEPLGWVNMFNTAWLPADFEYLRALDADDFDISTFMA